MAVAIDSAELAGIRSPAEPPAPTPARGAKRSPTPVLLPWLRAQSINVRRHAAALRPFRREEFGTGGAAPSEGHVQAVNTLITRLRSSLLQMTGTVTSAAVAATQAPTRQSLQRLVSQKSRAHQWVRGIETIWDFYFELFGQRQGQYAEWLLACDRIATDCYQAAFTGVGTAKSIPAPGPFCYMRTGFAPATWRRGIPLKRLGRQLNPFPLIQLPYHRLVNPWTLAAVLHEVSHNLQSDLGLSRAIPRGVALRLSQGGLPQSVVLTWTRWNREMFSDMSAALLGGPGMVASIMDVVGREPRVTLSFNPEGVHPTPYLRILISVELLRRMGFQQEAELYRRAWTRIYPDPAAGSIPAEILETFPTAVRLAVDAMCFQVYPALGNRSLAQTLPFAQKEQHMIEESGRRLAAGNDPGIVPARFLIGAARFALDQRLARPGVIATNFYRELVRR